MTARHEIEAKFHCRDLRSLHARVLKEGGREIVPRLFERNLRFDTTDRRLAEAKQVLRLRQDRSTTLTFKRSLHGVQAREELEVELDSFQTGRALLEAIGFEITFIYEKYRQVLALGPAHIMLDELPFGHFAEVEGPSLEDIRGICQQLGLNWERRLDANYQLLFQRLVGDRGLTLRDATFEDFRGIPPASATELEGRDQVHPTGKVG